jgi:hypothetical protein
VLARRVLVCDDDLRRSAFEESFNDDVEARRREQGAGSLRRLEVDGQVCRSLAELRFALDEAAEAGGPPDLVLIDDLLQAERDRDPVRSALKAVRLIRSKFGDDGPKCVLHTTAPELNDIWTFCALGGHNVVDKSRPHERERVLWKTLDGGRWSPPELRTHVRISDANGRLLPYMEDSYWQHNATSDLGLTENAAHKAKERLVRSFQLPTRAEARDIVNAANAHGLAWVPLAYRHWLPEDHPEHRSSAFKHRLPGLSAP